MKCKSFGCLNEHDIIPPSEYCQKCMGIINSEEDSMNVSIECKNSKCIEYALHDGYCKDHNEYSESRLGKCSICCLHALPIEIPDSTEMRKLFGNNEFCESCELKTVNFLLDIRTARTE